ncbi:MAG: DUF4367 domain-containing protein [Blautia sp.]|jgi:hypothetical protein
MGKEEMDEIGRKLKQDITLTDTVNKSVEAAYAQIRSQAVKPEVKVKRYSRRPKKWIVLAAAAAALMGSSVIVMGAMGFFQKEKKLEEKTLTYSFDLDYELKPGTFEVTPGYLPEGYVEQEAGKYCTEDNWGHGFTLMPIYNTVELDNADKEIQMHQVAQVEPMELSGMEADVISFEESDKYELPTEIFLFNPGEGYVLQIWGDHSVPKEELVKVADSLTVKRTGDAAFATEEEKAQREEEEEAQRQEQAKFGEINAKGVSKEQIIPLGQKESVSLGDENSETAFTVKSAEFMDAWTDYDKDCFYDYASVEPWLKEDGTLKSYLRKYFEAGKDQIAWATPDKEDTAEQCFLKVEVQVEKKLGADAEAWEKETALAACVQRLLPEKDGAYGWPYDIYMPVESEHNDLQMDGRCIYLDQPENLEGEERLHQFFYREMEDGETLDYTIVFVVDKDIAKGPLVLSFDEFCNDGTAQGTFFAIK